MNKAVILCGGRGERLKPLTDKIPKPMIKIAGKPILEYLVSVLKKGGVKEIFFAVSYLGRKIEDYFRDGSKWRVNIYYSYDKEPLGGAGALKLLEERLNSTFVVLNGDVLTNIDIKKMLKFHQKKKGTATLFVHDTDHPYDSDLVEFDGKCLVKRFFRPQKGDKFKPVSKTGTLIFEPEIFKFIPKNKKFSIEKQLIPSLLQKRKKIYAYYSNEYSKDMGTLMRLSRVRKDYKEGICVFK